MPSIVKKRAGNTPKCVQDIRQALEDKDLDVVSVATCNHWHSLMTIWACQAGKDVYVEKPCSHNVFEGRQCVKAARKYKRIVQHGTQSRGRKDWARTVAAIASGKYGKLLVSKGYAQSREWADGASASSRTQGAARRLRFQLWLGPAPEQPYHENIVHYNWHWFWDFGNGEIGNQGVHQMDIARWGIPDATLPKSVISLGGRWTSTGQQRSGSDSEHEITVFDFDGTLLVFEARASRQEPDHRQERPRQRWKRVLLEEGKIVDGKFYPNGKDKGEGLARSSYLQPGGVFRNFIDCVRSRKQEDLLADIHKAHYSAALCHLGNISYRLGQTGPGQHVPKGLPDNPQAQESWAWIRQGLKDFLELRP